MHENLIWHVSENIYKSFNDLKTIDKLCVALNECTNCALIVDRYEQQGLRNLSEVSFKFKNKYLNR